MLAVTLWSVYIWTIATPTLRDRNGNLKGTDFLHFYTLGALAITHRGADLYNLNAQAAIAAQRVPDAAGIRYLPLYPPQVSLLFAPLAQRSYGLELIVWWLCSGFVYGACCWLFWRVCPNLRAQGSTVALLAAAFPAFFHLIAWGQTSAIALACFTALFFLLRARREFLAGLALGCLIFKPQLGLAAAVVFLAIGAWRVVAGAIFSAAAQLATGVLFYGTGPFRHLLRNMWNVRSMLPLFEPRPYQTHCLRTFWAMIVPWPQVSFTLYLLSSLIVLAWTITLNKQKGQSPELRFSALLFATVLVSPHLTVYDLVILAPAFLLLADWLIASPSDNKGMATLLYLVYMLPLVGPLARWTHIQLSVVAMTLLLWMILRAGQQSAELAPAAEQKG